MTKRANEFVMGGRQVWLDEPEDEPVLSLASAAPPSAYVEYAPPRDLPGEHRSARRQAVR